MANCSLICVFNYLKVSSNSVESFSRYMHLRINIHIHIFSTYSVPIDLSNVWATS